MLEQGRLILPVLRIYQDSDDLKQAIIEDMIDQALL